MFNRKNHAESELMEIINTLATQMRESDIGTDEFNKAEERLTRIVALRNTLGSERIDPSTRASILTNLAGILLILNHERVHVVTSKALGFVLKTR